MQRSIRRHLLSALFVATCLAGVTQGIRTLLSAEPLPPLVEVVVPSSLDKHQQAVRVWAPDKATKELTPIFVYLHSWSWDYKQDNSIWQAEAVRRGWIFLHPNFRGRNDHPEACGSALARQDILDALDYAQQKYKVDPERIYLAGTSGGGHMTMLMAGYHPDRFSAASSWVGISNLASWHNFHSPDGKPKNYALMMEACMGGPPGTSKKVDAEYESRSPSSVLDRVKDLPLDIAAGVEDGHIGSVPVGHSLGAFNILARQQKAPEISQEEKDQLWEWKRLKKPQPGDTAADPTYGRDILLRRKAGPSRVTIFQGDHEGLPNAACEWLAAQRRMTKR